MHIGDRYSTRIVIWSMILFLKEVYCAKSMYDGCGQIKTCLGAEENGMDCLKTRCCHYLVSFHYEASTGLVVVQMQSTRVNNFVSMGISENDVMGDDAVVQCFRNSAGKVTMASSRNEGQRNEALPTPIPFKRRKSSVEQDRIFCELALPLHINTGKESFDLKNQAYYLSVAGGVVSSARDRIVSHSQYGCQATKNKVNFTQTQKTEYSDYTDDAFAVLSIQIHTLCLTLTWMLCIPVAIFMARFYKETWADVHIFRRRLWFLSHSGMMLTGLLSALLGYIMIPISQKGLFMNVYDDLLTHQILGYVALVLLIVQCCGNWWHIYDINLARVMKIVHVILGALCYSSGLANIGFSYWTVPHHVPNSLLSLVVAWIVVFLLFYIGMSIYMSWTDKHLGVDGWRTVVFYPMPMVSDEEAPRPTLRKSILGGFIVCATVEFALTVYYILGVTETPCESTT